jgi:acetyltransferase-like isoleucine patch superfamily enzyme
MDLTHITGNSHIGNNVFISVLVSTTNDNVVLNREYNEDEILGPQLEDNVTVGAGAILLPGVHVKTGAFVGAGAVVTKDVSASDLVMGIPAKVVRKLQRMPETKEGG